MSELYELLEEMRYIKVDSISYPPHSLPAINITLATSIGISPLAIKLLQILPYVKQTPGPLHNSWNEPIMSATNWRAWRYNNELLLSTSFADMSDDKVLMGTRDPWDDDSEMMEMMLQGELSEDPEIPLLKSWQVALTGIDRVNLFHTNDTCLRGGKMILDLKTRNLWTVGSGAVPTQYYHDGSVEDRGSIDPVTRGQLAAGAKMSMSRKRRAQIEMYASRPATVALRDYIERYRSLEWGPGFPGGDRMIAYPRDAYREMYIKHGWPKKFDGHAFEKERISWDQENEAKWRAAEPIRQLLEYEARHEQNLRVIQDWKDDLAALDALNPIIKTEMYDSIKKTYRGRTREQILIAIEYRSQGTFEEENALAEMRRALANVTDDVRIWRDQYREKYGEDYNLGDFIESVRYG